MMIVYNPRSSGYGRVRREVIEVAYGMRGWMVGKYEVRDTDVDDNARRLAKILVDGDLVVAAGGDGTASIAVNGVLISGRRVRVGVLGYGNFNDLARTFGAKSLGDVVGGKTEKVWPLEAVVDGRRWRWAVGYFTIGMFAEATEVFDEDEQRKKLQTGRRGAVFSWGIMVGWYFRNRRREFLPRFRLNGVGVVKNTTDYVAVNGRWMARLMQGRRWYRGKTFWSEVAGLASFWRLAVLMVRSILWRVPGRVTGGDVLEFVRPATVEIQGEGEYRVLRGVRKIEIRKGEKWLEIVSVR